MNALPSVCGLSGKEGNGRKPAGFLLFVTYGFCFRGNRSVSSCS
jgi:hypothetical protein